MAAISLQGVTKRFGQVVAIHDLDLEVYDHEFLVLLGPSGAGKTTTLRTVAGLERPDAGSIAIGGKSMNGKTPAERNVAFVFQDYALYPFMTAYQNMAFPLKARPTSAAEIDASVRRVAQVLQIEHLLQRKPAQLSGGEQQRVALGRAMVRRPRAFLMDEPLTNLDAKLRTLMRAELKHLHRAIGATTLYVTHDQIEAMTMGDRIAVLRDGACQQVGTPDVIYGQPANTFVAGFVGHPRMNLLAGEAARTADGQPAIRLDEGGGLAPLASQVPAGHDRVILGIRPEAVTLLPAEAPGALSTTVYAVEPQGDRYIYDLQMGAAMLKVKAPPDLEMAIGDRAWARFDPAEIHLFDAASQRRLTAAAHG